MSSLTRSETIERHERLWGWYETLSEVPGRKVKRLRINPGQQLSLQKHQQRAEHWIVALDQAQIAVGKQVLDLKTGAHLDIAIGQANRLANHSAAPIEIIEIQFGRYLGEDDILRLSDDYHPS